MNENCIYVNQVGTGEIGAMSDYPTMPTRARTYEQLTDDERKLVRVLQ